jgi:hypothetical protein
MALTKRLSHDPSRIALWSVDATRISIFHSLPSAYGPAGLWIPGSNFLFFETNLKDDLASEGIASLSCSIRDRGHHTIRPGSCGDPLSVAQVGAAVVINKPAGIVVFAAVQKLGEYLRLIARMKKTNLFSTLLLRSRERISSYSVR